MQKIRRSAIFLLLLACLPVVAPAAVSPAPAADAEPDAERLGWHGEEMPAGMVRADAEGEYRWLKDGAIMVYVPPGPFPMGSEEGATDERPVHEVHLDGFYVDKHEVSWGRWKLSGLPYTDDVDSRLRKPRAPDWGILDDHPALNIGWHDAVAYAEWAGKELPTEAQWEKAARGTDGRQYPWGDGPPNEERAIWLEHPIARKSTAPVDCCAEGASPYGVLNMAGNVYEWCRDVYDADFYARSPEHEPVNLEDGRYRVLRGGAFVLEVEDMRSAYRYRLLPEDRAPYIGFRTVVSGVGPASEGHPSGESDPASARRR